MAVTTKEEGVWILPDVYAKQQQGSIWEYTGIQGGYSLGINQEGAAGVNVGPTTKYSSPTQLAGAAANWHEVHGNGGMFGSVAMHGIKTDGSLWGWGNMGSYGAGGFNKPGSGPSNVSSPVMINGGAGGLSSLDSSGGGACVFRDSSGKLFSWGLNTEGQLGHNDKVDRSSPIQIGTDTTWSANIACAAYNMMAVKTDGTLWTWGANHPGDYTGALGQNNKTQYSSPRQVGTDTTWSTTRRHCSMGPAVGACIKTDGTLWTWGKNPSGVLGLNNNTDYSSPKQVPGTTWDSITIGTYGQATALKTDGTIWQWGSNTYGSLGQNNRTSYSSPRQVGTSTDWRFIDGGNGYINRTTFAIKNDNTLWAWGNGADAGLLGLNENSNYSSPVQVPGSWKYASAGRPNAGLVSLY